MSRRNHGVLGAAFVTFLFACAELGPPDDVTEVQQGLSFPNGSYTAGELFKPLSVIRSTNASGSFRGHSNVAVFKGYLLVPWAVDSGKTGGGLSIYDLTDPRSPVLVKRVDHSILREAHGFAFSSSYGGDYVVFQTTAGIEFWDLTDVTNPIMRKRLDLSGILANDYDLGAWWVFWQAPYVYVGGSGNGLYIVEANDIAGARMLKRIDQTELGNFRVGSVFAFGNLMVIASNDQPGLATIDISDPVNPAYITSTKGNADVYSSTLMGYRILTAGVDGALHVYDVSNPSQINFVRKSPVAQGNDKGGYVTYQDGFAHVGFSLQYAKIDIRNDASYSIVNTGTSGRSNRDEDFATVIGNLVFLGDDHAVGSAIVPHQQQPDTTGPSVIAVNPKDLAVSQRTSTRVGITFSDTIDPTSLNGATFIVRPVGSSTALPGKYSSQFGIANFGPAAPLAANTTYEVIIPAGGVKDVVGNTVPTQFVARFSTGPTIGNPLACTLAPTTPTPVGAAATLTVNATGGGTKTYSFTFGDGTPPTPFGSSATATHSYAPAGHYTVLATVKNATETATCSRVQTAHNPLTSSRPTSASTIIYDGQTNLAWVVNPDQDTVTAIDGVAHTKRVEVAVGAAPRTLARAPDGTVWVVNQASASVSVLNGTSGASVATISLPARSRPYGIAFAPDGSAGFVTTQGTGALLKLSPSGRNVLGSVALGGQLRGIAISADSRRVLVTRFISPANRGEVVEVDPASLAVVRTMALARDPGPDTEDSGRGLPNYLSAITISPDGGYALIPSKKDNIDRGLVRDGRALTFESTVRTIVSHLDLVANAEVLARRTDLNDRDMAQAVAFSKYGDYLAVSVQGSGAIEILDAYTRAGVSGLPNVGTAPQGVAFSSDFRKLFVNNFMSRTVTIHDASGFIDASSSTAPLLATVTTVGSERLSATVLRGKRIFYNANDRRMNRDGYIACASCHLDGDSDGRVWDFTDQGEGLRNTVALAGRGGMRQGFVHWTANFDEIQDFEHPIRGLFGGSGFMTNAAFNTGTRNQPLGDPKAGASADLDALAAFVASLGATNASPFRDPDGSFTADAEAGKLLFGQLGCPSCHGGPELTDSGAAILHDVGTLKPTSGGRLGQPLTGLDTPTLKGIWETAPYLHDGSAATLYDVLTSQNPNDLHGVTSTLSETELGQLVAYLAQLDELATPQVTISGLSVRDSANAADWSVPTNLTVGDTAFGDRTYTIAQLPAELAGTSWIRPANDSKSYTGTPLVSFVISRQADVHVSIDNRVARPSWVDASWTNTQSTLVIRESSTTTRPCTVYRKTFPAGTVSLGPWANSGVNMYEIVVK